MKSFYFFIIYYFYVCLGIIKTKKLSLDSVENPENLKIGYTLKKTSESTVVGSYLLINRNKI